jgi:ATP-dependent Lon protease
MSKPENKKIGFLKHTCIEKILKKRLIDKEAESPSFDFSYRKVANDQVSLVENIGDVEIFSIADVNNYWLKAEIFYGEDRKKYARNLLVELAKSGNRKNMIKAPSLKEIEILAEKFPNFREATDHLKSAVALSNLIENRTFEMSPILLVGEPGLGKTAFCQSLATILDAPFKRFDIGCMSTASVLSGLSFGWGSGHTGEILNTFMDSKVASPVFLLDEIDKISGHYTMPIQPTLLALLEPESSCNFKDEGLLVKLNCSKVFWIATANDIDAISKPLLSRFSVIHVQKPDKIQSDKIIKNIYSKIKNKNSWGKHFEPSLGQDVSDALNCYLPREISVYLKVAFGNAARRNSSNISIQDLTLPKMNINKNKIGYL